MKRYFGNARGYSQVVPTHIGRRVILHPKGQKSPKYRVVEGNHFARFLGRLQEFSAEEAEAKIRAGVWHLEFSESAIRERDRRGNEALFGPVVENIESGRDHRGRDIEPEPAPEPVAAPEPAEVEEEEPEPVEETVAAPEEEEGEGEDAVQFDSVEGTFTEEDILDLALGGRKTLMAMAKELGISAKGKNAELAAAVAKGAFSE